MSIVRKLRIAPFICFVLCVVNSYGQGFNPFVPPPTQESFDSYFSVVDNIDWGDHTVGDKGPEVPCRDELWAFMEARLSKVKFPKEAYMRTVFKVRTLYAMIDGALSGGFENIEVPLGDMQVNGKRNKMLNSLQKAKDYDDFVRRFKRPNNAQDLPSSISVKDYQWLEYIFEYFEDIKKGWTFLFTEKIEGTIGEPCNIILDFYSRPKTLVFGKITWELQMNVKVDCPCKKPDDTIKNVRDAKVIFTSVLDSNLPDNEIHKVLFTSATKPKMNVVYINCCPEQEDDEDPKDGEDGSGNDDHGSVPGGNSKECCDNNTGRFTIGLFPTIALANNFEDSGFGIDVEGLYKIGPSFGDNEWFVGLQGGYITQSSQDGEVDENLLSGAVIIENRTPILPCVQWVQRICGQYGTGTINVFEFEEDVTQTSVGIHTGFNLNVSETISIGADATILTVGSTTFTPENGPEVKTDIGSFALGRQRVRFGFRFRF